MPDVALSTVLGGTSSNAPRRENYTLTSSNASLPIPAWAQGGKGVVYVTGGGGGEHCRLAYEQDIRRSALRAESITLLQTKTPETNRWN